LAPELADLAPPVSTGRSSPSLPPSASAAWICESCRKDWTGLPRETGLIYGKHKRMSKQILLNQAVLEFHGPDNLPGGITQALEKKLDRADWTELLQPVLQGIPAKIRVVDVSGPGRMGKKPAKTGRSRKKGTFCVGITRIGYGSKTFEISDVTAAEAESIALEQAGNHEFTETNSEYEVLSVREKS
jgi:hypothetical protein